MQNAFMSIMQIRDVPEDVQAEFVRRAKDAHQSLQQYMRALLIAQARRPDTSEVWARLEQRVRNAGGSYELSDAVDDVRRLRDEGPSR